VVELGLALTVFVYAVQTQHNEFICGLCYDTPCLYVHIPFPSIC